MDCGSYLQNYTPIGKKLRAYGFCEQNGGWVLERDLPFQDLFVRIKILPPQFEVRVIDRNFNDDFLPFNVKDSTSPVKAAVQNLLDEVLTICFANTTRDVVKFCEQTFQTKPERPWKEFPDFMTFKTNRSQKWYALMMRVSGQKLGLTNQKLVDVVNLKLPPEQILSLIDNVHYFPAYHMNKKYWLTVLLNQTTDMEKLKTLIQVSYGLVEK